MNETVIIDGVTVVARQVGRTVPVTIAVPDDADVRVRSEVIFRGVTYLVADVVVRAAGYREIRLKRHDMLGG